MNRRPGKNGPAHLRPRCELCNHPTSPGHPRCSDTKRCKQRRLKQERNRQPEQPEQPEYVVDGRGMTSDEFMRWQEANEMRVWGSE
jgi:hypothetical protein